MMADHIWDDTDGTHLAYIKDGMVFAAADNRHIGSIRDGDIYGLDGELIGHLRNLDSPNKGPIPEAFRKLAKGARWLKAGPPRAPSLSSEPASPPLP